MIVNYIKQNLKAVIVIAVVVSMGIAYAIPSEEQKALERVRKIAEYDYKRDTIITNAKSNVFNLNECIEQVKKEYKSEEESKSCEYRTYVNSITTASGASGGGATAPTTTPSP